MSSYSPKVLADRPIAFFEMTEVAGAAIVDSSPNARRGAIVGGVTLGAEGPIPGGKSLELDGSSGHVALEGSWASGGGELTIEVWVRGIRGGSEGQAIVSSTTTELVHLQMSEDPGYRNALYADNGDHMVPVLSPLPLEVWRHIAFIVRPGMVTIVEDGVVRSETAVTFTDLRPTSLLRIGCGWGGGRFFAGRIGPLAIYDRALSVAAIRGHLGLPTVDATIYAARVLGDQPIAYFPMGEVAGTAIADQSSHGRRGTLEGGVRVGAAGPIEGTKSLEFDGSGRVVLDGSWAGEGGELTVEVWVWSARGGPEGQAIVSAVGGEFVHLQMSDDPGYRNAIYTDAGYSLVPVLSPAPIGVWRHIVLIVRPGTVTIVEDGVVRSETACAFNEIVPSSIVHVGSGYGYGRFFAGRIGPLAIYARALTPAEIRAHLGFDEGSSDEVREEAAPGTYDEAVLADGPVAFFNWRSTEGGIARDVTDAARTGALHGAVTVTDAEGLVGLRCLELDGKTGEVRLDGEWGGGTELTVEAWICSGRSSWDTQAVVAAADEAFLFLHCNNDDEKKIRIFTTGADDEKVELPVVSTLPLDQWRHVVVAARSGSQRLYVDGVLITEESTSYGLLTPTKDLRIGAGYGGARHYQGKIGPVAIFDRQLAPENVMAHYRAATDGRGPTLYFGELCVLLLAEEGSTVFSASVDSVPITAILSALLGGVALPPEVPKVTLKNVEVSLDLSDGALKVSGDAVTFLRIEGVDLTATARLVYERGGGPNHPKKCAITLGALGPVEVVPGLSVGSVELAFAYQETEKTDEETKKKTIERSWAVGGGLSTSILGVSLALSAGYEVKDGKRKLTLFGQLGDSGRTLLDIFEVAAIKATQVILTLAKPVDADDDDDRLEVSLSVSSGVRFLDIVDVNMTLEIADEEKRRFLALTMDQASYFEIPIEVGSGLKIRISAPRIALTQKIDGDKKTYEIEAKVSLALLGLPEWVHRYACFPRKVTGELKGTKEGLILKATNILEPLDIALPNLDLGAGVVIETSKLGTTRLHLRELSAKILKKKPEGTLTVSLGLPAGVNRIFGVDENDQPRANIFRTFNPQQPLTSTIDFEIGVGTGADNKAKFILRLKNSPVTFLVIQDGVWYVDLGEFGAFEVDIPTFTSKDGGFAATGGLRVTRDFAIPLVHAKALLGLLGLGDVAARLPTKIPAMDVRLYDEEGKLAARKVVEYCASFASGVGLALPEGLLALLEPPLEAVAEFTERLPDAFKDYLSIEVPRTLSFDVVYRGETNFSINIWGDEDRPLRLFLPYWNMTPMFPLLIGVSMSRLSVGMLLGGNLVSLQTTATIDVFDPFTIAAGMVIPPNQWIPQGSAMLRQLVIEDLMMFVVTATKIPIPIPLFYEKLAFRVQGVEGIYIGAGAHFPMPQLGITEAVRMVSALLHFFKDPAARLPMIEASDVNTEIAVIAVGSALDVWAINSGGELLRRASDGSGTWSVIGTPAAPTHVSVGGDGTPWILADRIPYRREADGTWTSWAAQRFEHLDAASRDQVAAVDGEGVIFRYEPGPNAWAPVEGIAEHRVVRIATDATGAFWAIAEHRLPGAVTRGRFFWRSAEGPWNLDLNRTFDQIAIASLSHHAGVAPDGTIHVYAAGPGWQR
ncbi:MAG: LamG domain-containing protein, partial [Myxococcales bacterium]|nr:LamG domain-containing protein [Myxococcales bacterium]